MNYTFGKIYGYLNEKAVSYTHLVYLAEPVHRNAGRGRLPPVGRDSADPFPWLSVFEGTQRRNPEQDGRAAAVYPQNAAAPVSYTHLDVYKRQLYVLSGIAVSSKSDSSSSSSS